MFCSCLFRSIPAGICAPELESHHRASPTEALSMGFIAQTGSAATLSASCTMQTSLNLRLLVGNMLEEEMLQLTTRMCSRQAASCHIVSSMLVCQHQFQRVIEQCPDLLFSGMFAKVTITSCHKHRNADLFVWQPI